jgi:hypothetical protein
MNKTNSINHIINIGINHISMSTKFSSSNISSSFSLSGASRHQHDASVDFGNNLCERIH